MTQVLARSPNPQPYKFTVEAYEAVSEAGLLTGRTELIDGVIVEMPPMGDAHTKAIFGLTSKLVIKYHPRAEVGSQVPVRLPPFGEPEPDFMLVRPGVLGVPEVYRNPKNTVPGGWGYDPPIICQPGTAIAPLEFPQDPLEWWT
jgi:Uma2 family endonuclease